MFYDRFCELCKRKGVSCSKAASEIGLGNSTVTMWKKRGSTPSGDVLIKIANHFGVSVADLLGDDLQTISEESHKIRNDLIFEVKETRIKNSPEPQSEEQGNMESLPEDYFKLNKENRAAIDDLIAKLAAGQSQP